MKQGVGRFGERPIESMAERGVLTFSQLRKIDDVQCQQVFVLERQTHIMQSGVIGANSDIYPSLFAAHKQETQNIKALQRAGSQVRSRADFKALSPVRNPGQQFRVLKRDINAMPDAVYIRQQFRIHAVGRLEQVTGGFQAAGAGIAEQVYEIVHAFAVGDVGGRPNPRRRRHWVRCGPDQR